METPESHSKQNEYAGLPKAIRLVAAANANATIAGFNGIAFDTIVFNYGPFTLTMAGALVTAVTVNEPGIYYVSVQALIGTGSIYSGLFVFVNGGNTTNNLLMNFGPNGSVYNTVQQAEGLLELKSGDVLQPISQGGAAVAMPAGGYCTFTVEKRGGQY